LRLGAVRVRGQDIFHRRLHRRHLHRGANAK
jgi:hypothetical protein